MSSTTSMALIVAFVLVGFPLAFGALWIFITRLMSFIGGWDRVGQHFAAPKGRPDGRMLRRVTGMFGIARYKAVLTVITTAGGIYIENRTVFRPGHPPLFIPFEAIRNAKKQTLFFWEYVAFDIGDPVLASVRLPSKVFEGTPVAAALSAAGAA
jgi:hypothetical protein